MRRDIETLIGSYQVPFFGPYTLKALRGFIEQSSECCLLHLATNVGWDFLPTSSSK